MSDEKLPWGWPVSQTGHGQEVSKSAGRSMNGDMGEDRSETLDLDVDGAELNGELRAAVDDLRAVLVRPASDDVTTRHLARMAAAASAAAVTSASVAPTRNLVREPSWTRRALVAASAAVVAALGLGGLGMAGALPGPVQDAVADVGDRIGLDMPHRDDDAADDADDAEVPDDPGTGTSIPGVEGVAPGQSGETPGQSGAEPPGQSGQAPGQSGSAPGQSGSAPGQSGSAPGQSGSAPGQSGSAPGQSGQTPSQTAPGQSGSAPGQSGFGSGPVRLEPFGDGAPGGPVPTPASRARTRRARPRASRVATLPRRHRARSRRLRRRERERRPIGRTDAGWLWRSERPERRCRER